MPTLKVGGGRCTGRRRTRGRWRRRGRRREPMGRRKVGRLRSTKTMGGGRGRSGVRVSIVSDGRRRGGRRGGAESGRRSRGGGGGAKSSVAVGGGKTAKGVAGTSTKTRMRGCGGRAGDGCGWLGEGGGRCRLGGGRGRVSRGGTSRGGDGVESGLGSFCSFGFDLGATLSLVCESTRMVELKGEPLRLGFGLTCERRGAGGGGEGTTLSMGGPALGLSKSGRQVGRISLESGVRSAQLGVVR